MNKNKKDMERRSLGQVIKEYANLILVAFCIAMVIKIFVIDSRLVPTTSMYPTVYANDRVLVNKFIYRFRDVERQDIIVFRPNESINEKKDLLKRVIGLPGDKVKVENGRVFINGEELDESFYEHDIPTYTFAEVEVPEGCIFVLGDNRNRSFDSHLWDDPFVPLENIKGKAFLCYWPLNRIDTLQ